MIRDDHDRPAQSRLRKSLRIVAYVVLGTFVVTINLVAGLFIFMKSNRAREMVVTFGLKKVQPAFPGGLSIGSSEGDLTRGITLHDVELRDLDGRAAIKIARAELRYSLLPLLWTRVQVDIVRVEGLTIVSQPLADGRDNLATMATIQLPKPPSALPVAVVLTALQIDGRFVRLPSGMTLDSAPRDNDVRAQITTSARLSRGMVATIDQLLVDVAQPARATITAAGSVHIAQKPEFHDLTLRVDGDTTELRRRVGGSSKLELSGPASIVATADGALDNLLATLAVDTDQPRIVVRARGHVYADRAQLENLDVTAPFANAHASGVYEFNHLGHGAIHVDATDLRPLALLGAPDLAGTVKLDAKVARDEHHVTAEATGHIKNFRLANNRIERVDLDVNTVDLSGHALVTASNLRLGNLVLNVAKLAADGDSHDVHVATSARGPEGLSFEVAVAARPNDQRTRLDATLERLRFAAGGTPWKEDHATRITADFAERLYALAPLGLNNGKQHLTVEGRLVKDELADVHVDLKHFDLSQLPALLSPGHALPHTDLQAQLEASGPLTQPNIGAHFSGNGDGRTQHDLIRFTTTGEGRLALGRANAHLFVTIGGQKASATIDAPFPLKPNQPLDIALNASVLLNPWFADLLVPKAIQSQPILMYRLGAKVTAQASIKGTTSDPKINASVRVARWGAANSHGDLAVSIEYANQRLNGSGTMTISSLPLGGGKGAGLVEATAELPIDLAPAFSGLAGNVLETRAEWHGALNLKHVEIEKLPWEALDLQPVVRHGWIDARAELAGTPAHPRATVHFDAKDLDVNGVGDVGASGNARIDGIATTADMRLSVQGSDALLARGTLGMPLDEQQWKDAQLAVTIEVPGFPLAKLGVLKSLEGLVRGTTTISGSWRHPAAMAKLAVTDLRSGATTYKSATIDGTLKHQIVAADLAAEAANGAKLTAHLEAPLDGGKLNGAIAAEHFVIDLKSDLAAALVRSLKAELDGNVRIAGTTKRPELLGELQVAHGDLVLSTTAITYHDVGAVLAFTGNDVAVRGVHLTTGSGGALTGDGHATLRNFALANVTGNVALKRFPLTWDTNNGLVDGNATLEGRRASTGGFTTLVTIAQARVLLIEDRARRGLISLTHLEDVNVGKARPEPVANPLDTPRVTAPPSKQFLVAIKGPLMVHGAEMDVAATADVHLDFSSEIPTAHGTLALTPHGTTHVFGETYDLEHGRVTFGNVAQPELDLRLSRAVAKGKIGVDLGGSTRQPTLTFWADPPAAYTTAQVASLVTQQPLEKNRVAKSGMDQKVGQKGGGPISSLIAVSFNQSDPANKTVDVEHPQPTPLSTMNKQ